MAAKPKPKSDTTEPGEAALTIKYLPPEDITPYENNSRTHSEAQIEQLKKSIKEFGITTPIALHNGVIVYGHARFRAMTEMGYTKIPTVDISHLSEAQKRAYVIADNKLAMNAGWDLDILESEVDLLKEMDFNVDVLGFTEGELNFDWESDIELIDTTIASLDAIRTTLKVVVAPSIVGEISDKIREMLEPYGDQAEFD